MEQAYVADGTSIDKGENARLSSIIGAIAISDLVKTTLGPAGLDKILQRVGPNDQSIEITNDGATILKNVHVDNAAAKVLVDIAKVQDDTIGDGTTSVAVLAGELLREAETLMNDRLHPQTICQGFRQAKQIAEETLDQIARTPDNLEAELLQIAKTTLSSKLLKFQVDYFAQLAVSAVLRLQNSQNLEHIQILKFAGASIQQSYLEDGFLLPKLPGNNQPQTVAPARILLANTSLDTDKIKIYGSRVKVSSITELGSIEQAEKEKLKNKVQKILQHADQAGEPMNVFINRQLIYNYPESLFAENNIMAIEHADFDGIERLGAVLGGHISSTFDAPKQTKLGRCERIDTILIGDEKVLRFSQPQTGAACSIVLRGPSQQFLDEAERSLHDALAVLTAVLKSPRTVLGGGNAEMRIAQRIEAAAAKTPGKPALAMTKFAQALTEIPKIIADNAGHDATQLVSDLRVAIQQNPNAGLDILANGVGDMETLGIRESHASKKSSILAAAEAAEMILRVDDIIKAAPRRRQEMGY